ncbi:MAG: riboflavin biosynthesis protein RibF, partial [Thermoplasmata archaeon]|nr:riboflavin biosynthesis protein RibF [Thermoplasmata archaeon]
MKIIRGSAKVLDKPLFFTMGSFDGVHLGHQKVISRLVKGKRSGAVSMVMTFEPHPRAVAATREHPLLLTTTEHKLRLVEESGVDYCVIVKFDSHFSRLGARDFIENILLSRFSLEKIVVGSHNR